MSALYMKSIKFRLNQLSRVVLSLIKYFNKRIRERMHYDREDEIFSSKYIHLPRGFNDISKRKFLKRGYRDEVEIQSMIESVSDYTMVTYDGLASVCDIIRFVEQNSISGCFVELGTWKGGTLALMGLASLKYGKGDRILWGFDSFRGLPSPHGVFDKTSFLNSEFGLDHADYDKGLSPINALTADVANIHGIINTVGYPIERVRVIEGWFQETIPVVKNELGTIALLRMDGDLYDSYKIPLEALYDQVAEGGFIIFDDWMLKGCRQAVLEFFETLPVKPFIHKADYSVRYIRKARMG